LDTKQTEHFIPLAERAAFIEWNRYTPQMESLHAPSLMLWARL